MLQMPMSPVLLGAAGAYDLGSSAVQRVQTGVTRSLQTAQSAFTQVKPQALGALTKAALLTGSTSLFMAPKALALDGSIGGGFLVNNSPETGLSSGLGDWGLPLALSIGCSAFLFLTIASIYSYKTRQALNKMNGLLADPQLTIKRSIRNPLGMSPFKRSNGDGPSDQNVQNPTSPDKNRG